MLTACDLAAIPVQIKLYNHSQSPRLTYTYMRPQKWGTLKLSLRLNGFMVSTSLSVFRKIDENVQGVGGVEGSRQNHWKTQEELNLHAAQSNSFHCISWPQSGAPQSTCHFVPIKLHPIMFNALLSQAQPLIFFTNSKHHPSQCVCRRL